MVSVASWTSRRTLLRSIDSARVKSALENAEEGTSGHIRVSIAAPFWGNIHEAAKRTFDRLGMHRTIHRNAVLVLIIPSRRRLVIHGDAAIHAKAGQAFWESVSQTICEKFGAGDYTGGIVGGVEVIGAELRQHFPREPTTASMGVAGA